MIGPLAYAPPIVRRIASAVRAAAADGYTPRLLYLSADDRRALAAVVHLEKARRPVFGGLEIRHGIRSRVICRFGAIKNVPKGTPP